ncbi:hypothetical protein lbkm_3276 [Lachnospiraceae bacterium KM106-2]|nr:hypothetical protein lbkm_3276 [Lachnospiraceae bacterium KM106-2]
MRQVEEKEFKKENIIYVEHLQSGMNQYHWDVIQGKEEAYNNLFQRLLAENSGSQLYVDFYYNRLGREEHIKLKKKLNPKDQIILNRLLDKHNETDSIYYECDERWIPFFLHLSYRELLFQTFYFTDPKVTIWSNYEGKFIAFTEDLDARESLIKKVKESGLYLDETY